MLSRGGASPAKVGLLGNLILVDSGLNEKLANKDFTQKLKILKQSRVAWIGPQIEAATKWGDSEIEKRTEYLAELAYKKVWHL